MGSGGSERVAESIGVVSVGSGGSERVPESPIDHVKLS